MKPSSYLTPGVYIKEEPAFSNSIVSVNTNVAAFIGYTQKADLNGISLSMKPTRITSFAEFLILFGGAPDYRFSIGEVDAPGDFVSSGKILGLTQDSSTACLLYNSIRFFYANGGSACYIVSVGSYTETISSDKLMQGLKTLENERESATLLIPEAVLLPQNDCYNLQRAMLLHCSVLQSRFAILDIWQGDKKRDDPSGDVIATFRDAIGTDGLSYGAAYYPWVNTTLIKPGELNFTNVSNISTLQDVLNDSLVTLNLSPAQTIQLQATITSMSVAKPGDVTGIHNTLMTSVPLYGNILSIIGKKLGCLPPAPAMAGIYAQTDQVKGVWKAPANICVVEAGGVTVNLSNDDQSDLNSPLNGKAINALRLFTGMGVMVWGARTLDGNSQDWRYINVRRTVLFIEQSIKNALQQYIFQPNSTNTWVNVKSMITSFLTDQWKQGALVGSKPADAFSVSVGLGSTMTTDSILNGYMDVSVLVSLVRPAEFISLTFQQQMQTP